jgi:DNA gyrase subunit B
MITVLGTGIGSEDFDLSKLRYHKIILMSDADVDGSHITTLILTFFYRQVPEIIEKGHLFVAQPPLYRVKHGKEERYLTDDIEFEDYLLQIGTEGVSIRASENGTVREIKGSRLLEIIKKSISYGKILERLGKWGRDRRIVDAFARRKGFRKTNLKVGNESELDSHLKEVKEFIEKRYPEIQSLDWGLSEDEEHNALRIVYSFKDNGRRGKTVIDFDFINSPDFSELKNIADGIHQLGEPPFTILQDEKETKVDNLKELTEYVLSLGKKGMFIQRYKGLGEMNPAQLWETTMNPETRILKQVNIEDTFQADEIFTVLMGDQVEPRKEFIEKNALNVTNLDI